MDQKKLTPNDEGNKLYSPTTELLAIYNLQE